MTLSDLKQKLQTVTGTNIGEVFFDWKRYQSEARSKTYPCVLWILDGMEFVGDARNSTIQKTETLTLTVFAIDSFNTDTDDKITVWDTLKSDFEEYLDALNSMDGISIDNISSIKGQYAGEGLVSPDKEIGIIYRNVVIKTWC